MSDIAALLAVPAVRSWYLAFCFAVMVLPMIGLSVWYHRNIRATPGGRALMKRQNQSHHPARGSLWGAVRSMRDASRLVKDIGNDAYGVEARRMQTVVYWFVGLWLIANVICFGILIWADELNR